MSRLFAIASRMSRLSRTPTCGGQTSLRDQEYLDSVFETILAEAEQGRGLDPEAFTRARPELRSEIEELIELALTITPTAGRRGLPPGPPGYTIVSEIGRGGMATVYLAKQHSVGDRPVAIKMLPELLTSHSTRERFRREAAAIASLRHGHVVPVHDIVGIGDSFAFAMEYIDGGTLHDVISAATARGSLPLEDAAMQAIKMREETWGEQTYVRMIAQWGLQIADALHAVHAAGLLHRDVKPSNVLIRRDGTALLSDFGLARDSSAASLTASGAFAGTAAYSSPEQLRGMRSLDTRSDVYSLGATLFHALTLRRPFAGDSAVQVLLSIGERGAPSMRSEHVVPADLALVVRKAMDPDPARRYATAADFAADLLRFIEHRPVVARKASWMYRARKYVRRYRTQVAAALAAGLAVAALAVAVFTRVVLWPQWSDEALMAARRVGASSRFHNLMFNYEYWELPEDNREAALKLSNDEAFCQHLVETLRSYDRAISYGDTTPQTRAERDAVELLLGRCTDRPMLGRDVEVSLIVSDYLEWIMKPVPPVMQVVRAGSESFPLLNEAAVPVLQQLPMAGARDARQIGLIAYELGDVGTALRAWKRMERLNDPDPFSEGMLGLLLLIDDAPVAAYPRLYRAALAFPLQGEFSMYAADAAIRCRDVEKARQLLEHAKSLPATDRRGFVRLDIMLRLESGDVIGAVAEARDRFAQIDGGASVVLGVQLAKRLLELGGPEQMALEFAGMACWTQPIPPRAVRTLLPLAARYWARATFQEKQDIVARAVATENGLDHGLRWPDGLLRGIFASSRILTPNANEDVFLTESFIAFRGRFESTLSRIKSPEFRDAISAAPDGRRDEIARWLLTGDREMPSELKAR